MARRLHTSRVNHTLVPMATIFRPSPTRLGVIAAVAALAIAAASIAITDTSNGPDALRPASPVVATQDETPDFATEALAGVSNDSGSSSERPVYRYSVVPGGTYNEGELQSALDADPVVAAHYTQLDRSRVRKEVVARDRLVHVSYRKGNDVFWTKKKVLLRQGETILTDGKTQVRARCGNCIAEEALGPTSEDEPDIVEFDRLVTDRPVAPIEAPSLAAVTPPSMPQELPARQSYPPYTPAAGLAASGGAGNSPSPVTGSFGGGGGASVPLVRANPAVTREPGEENNPGDNSPANGPDSNPGKSPDPETPSGTSPSGPGGDQPAVDVPIPGGDDPIPILEEITLIPTDPQDPGPGDPGDPTTTEVPPGGQQPANPVPVPEPATLLLVGGGVAVLIRHRRARAPLGHRSADKRDTL